MTAITNCYLDTYLLLTNMTAHNKLSLRADMRACEVSKRSGELKMLKKMNENTKHQSQRARYQIKTLALQKIYETI